MDWAALRARIATHGMRNSNCVAIAPTATISNIIGVAASIEPEYQNLYVKSNLSGEFTVVNDHLVAELKKRNLWDEVMVADLKYFDGSLAPHRPRAGRPAQPLRNGVRGRAAVDRRGRRAPPEVDRPGAEPQHLHGRRVRARSSTRPTSSPGCAASRRRTTCARWRRPPPRSRPAAAASSTPCRRPAAWRRPRVLRPKRPSTAPSTTRLARRASSRRHAEHARPKPGEAVAREQVLQPPRPGQEGTR